VLEQLLNDYDGSLSIVYRHLPLSTIHDKAILAAEASEAAGAQGEFWEYHDLLFERQDDWAGQSLDEARETFVSYAEELALETDQFRADLDEETYREKVEQAQAEAQAAQINSTPTIVINGYPFPLSDLPLNQQGVDFFLSVLQLAERQSDLPSQVIDPDKRYQATIVTEKGDIVIDLFSNTAPTNVNSFVHLAQSGWYDDITFHRVLEGFMAQGGDPSGTGFGWPGYRCDDEVAPERSFDMEGMVALANSGPNTNGGQFFITFGPAEHLNAGFTIIGQIASGQDVVDSLTLRDPEQNPDFEGDRIETITISEQ
jgi:cyclophilin family peptidyl-prolyl cis-trans isomerase